MSASGRLFRRKDLSMLLTEQLKELVARARATPVDDLNAASNETLASTLEGRYPLETPSLEETSASRSPIRDVVVPRNDYGRHLQIPGFELDVSVPVSGSAHLMLWEPSGYRSSLPPGELRGDSLELTYTWIPSESPNFEELLSRDLTDIRWWLRILGGDVERHREERRRLLLAELEKRREAVLAAAKLVSGSLLEKLPLQIARKDSSEAQTAPVAPQEGNLKAPGRDQVFISYAREDEAQAKAIADYLERRGLAVWIDKRKLLGGQNWKNEVRNAIKSSRYFVALLSSASVEKAGYVQKEVREALSVLESMPPNAVFIVPVRLEAVVPQHPQLEDLHWIDAFPDFERSLENIAAALGVS